MHSILTRGVGEGEKCMLEWVSGNDGRMEMVMGMGMEMEMKIGAH